MKKNESNDTYRLQQKGKTTYCANECKTYRQTMNASRDRIDWHDESKPDLYHVGNRKAVSVIATIKSGK